MTSPAPAWRQTAINALMFAAVAILWGSSAIVTGHQASSGAPEVSVGYRMTLVFLTMALWCRLTGLSLRLAVTDLSWVAAQGVLFFGLAFVTFYHATTLIPSGIAALILSTSTLFAAALGWIGFGQAVTIRMMVGTGCGIGGLAIVAAPQFTTLGSDWPSLGGLVLALMAAACTGAGTVVAMRNQKAGIPTAVLIAWAALVGAIFCFALALSRGLSFAVDATPTYLTGLAYLAFAASCATFFMYFRLVQRIGAMRAAYTLATVPIVAILLSVLFEGLALSLPLLAGSAAVLVGNGLVLSGRDTPRTRPSRLTPMEKST